MLSDGHLGTWSSACVVAAAAADAWLRPGTASERRVTTAAVGALFAMAAVGAAYRAPSRRRAGLLAASLAALRASALAAAVFAIAPALRTLAATVADDSVATVSAGLLLAHVALDDYTYYSPQQERGAWSEPPREAPGIVGTDVERVKRLARTRREASPRASAGASAGAGAALLLASRLRSQAAAGSFLVLSLGLMLLGPRARRRLRARSEAAHLAACYALALAAHCALERSLHAAIALAHLGVVLCVGLVCPLLLLRLHAHKRTISGPWDEARPAAPPEALRAKGCMLTPAPSANAAAYEHTHTQM